MENETNQPALCRNGCGFYGNPATDGMCSKCFKDSVRRKQSSPTSSPASASSSTLQSNVTVHGNAAPSGRQNNGFVYKSSNSSSSVDGACGVASISSSSLPLLPTSNSHSDIKTQDRLPVVEEPGPSDDNKDRSKTKRNRCFSCRKKVGLTGFECRCGNVFCGLHRYSDKHDCTFDYKAEGRAKITKDNPVILAEKIQKI